MSQFAQLSQFSHASVLHTALKSSSVKMEVTTDKIIRVYTTLLPQRTCVLVLFCFHTLYVKSVHCFYAMLVTSSTAPRSTGLFGIVNATSEDETIQQCIHIKCKLKHRKNKINTHL